MPIMQWDDSINVGLAPLDDEHREMIRLVNELFDAIQAGSRNEILAGKVDELVSLTMHHFRVEERLFAKTGFPEAEAHCLEHEDLAKQIIAVQAKARAGVHGTLTLEFMRYIRDWLYNHMRTRDVRFGEYARASGAN